MYHVVPLELGFHADREVVAPYVWRCSLKSVVIARFKEHIVSILKGPVLQHSAEQCFEPIPGDVVREVVPSRSFSPKHQILLIRSSLGVAASEVPHRLGPLGIRYWMAQRQQGYLLLKIRLGVWKARDEL